MKKFAFAFWALILCLPAKSINLIQEDQLKKDCELVIKQITMKQLDIVDSSLCNIIDSAYGFIKKENQVFKRPYCCDLILMPTESGQLQKISFNFSDGYLRFKDVTSSDEYYLLNYKEYQIIVNKRSYEDGLNRIFRLGNSNGFYKAYLVRIKGDENSTCFENLKEYYQSVIFTLQFLKTGKSHLEFSSYSYSLW